MPIKVLFFTNTLGSGGAEMHVLRLLNSLDRETYLPMVALARPGGGYERFLNQDVPVHYCNGSSVRSSTISLVKSVGPLRNLLKRERPQILCSFMDGANLVALRASAGAKDRLVRVLGVQSTPSLDYVQSPQLIHRVVLWLMRRWYVHAEGIVALSKGVSKELATLIPGLSHRIAVIYNAGYDANVLRKVRESMTLPDGLDRGKSGRLVVACGRLTRQKGFSFLLTAFSRVRRRLPARLLILGEGEERGALERQIAELGLADSVQLLGFQENPFQYMAAADVFVLSSLWEGFGNVIVEAMICGTTVLAADCPHGPAEIIENGINGVLVPPADSDALASRLLELLEDDRQRETLAKEARRRAEHFSAERITRQYEGLFKRLQQLKAS